VLGSRSIRLAQVLGVRIGVDPSWFFILFLVIWLLSEAYGDVYAGDRTMAFALAVLNAFLFFGSVILHELGHAVVARREGIRIEGIDLFLFGGVTRQSEEPRTPGADFRVAAAGPLVTLIIALAAAGAGVLAGANDEFEGALGGGDRASAVALVLGFLMYVNALLLVFNLLPGLPLDGGRIARAAAWRITGDRLKATRFAAAVGRGLAYLLMGLGLYELLFVEDAWVEGLWLILIGFFILQAARSAVAQSALSARLGGLRVSDVMDAEPVAVPGDTPLDRALDEFFLRYREPWFPVVDSARRVVGMLRREAVEEVPESERERRTAAEALAPTGAKELEIGADEPFEALLRPDALERMGKLGAVLAVDAQGVLRGVVTLDRVERALRPVSQA
jgi:Zn-dependent protease